MTTYIDAYASSQTDVALLDGVAGKPTVRTAGGVLASGEIVFADNPTATDTITINGVVVEFTAAASDATAAGTIADPLLVNIKASLALTLDEILVVCNSGTVPAAMQLATYTEDGVDTLTITWDAYGVAGNSITIAASSDTPSGATLAGGQELTELSLRDNDFQLTQAVNQNFTLANGVDGQEKFLYMTVKSGAGNAVCTPTSLNGFTTLTFDAANEMAHLKFYGGGWNVISATSGVAA